MASENGIAILSDLFDSAYRSPLDEKMSALWLKIFRKISDTDLERAAVRLIEHREKGSKVNPGEVTQALKENGIYVDASEYTKTFRDDPAVKALESRFRASKETEGISLHEWLKQEGLGSFQEAIQKYGDHPLPLMPGEPVPLIKDVAPF